MKRKYVHAIEVPKKTEQARHELTPPQSPAHPMDDKEEDSEELLLMLVKDTICCKI